jgi:hypothetical protein
VTPRPAVTGRVLLAVLAIAIAATPVLDLRPFSTSPGTAWWSSPDDPTMANLQPLESGGIRYGYAGYWVAYRLGLLSSERLQLTSVGPPKRDSAIDRAVARSTDRAWIFVPLTPMSINQFPAVAATAAPDGVTESQFETVLTRAGIKYRVVVSGMIQAVVPSEKVTPEVLSGLQGS